ncbi:TPA: hypothetical protein HA244_04825 [Candidatus Micrarchaeota archaeon]|nr:hypothetical protein [Candidatus Micrarchaeota archaeon]
MAEGVALVPVALLLLIIMLHLAELPLSVLAARMVQLVALNLEALLLAIGMMIEVVMIIPVAA